MVYDPDRHQSGKSDPERHQHDADPQYWIIGCRTKIYFDPALSWDNVLNRILSTCLQNEKFLVYD
jgi:hypothetical protein